MLRLISSIFLIGSVFLGCTGSLSQSSKTPDWYLLPPANTTNFIYGAGEGDTVDEAKQNALNDMSSRLIVSVGSIINTQTKTSSDGRYSKNISRDVTIESKKISFNNTAIDKLQENGNKIYIVMKANRAKLFRTKQKEFEIENNSLDNKIKLLENKTILEQIFALQDLKSEILDVKYKSFVLYAINNKFNYGKFYTKYDNYLNRSNNLKSAITVSVTSDNQNKFFANIVKNVLNKNSFQISSDDSDINIKLTNKVIYSMTRGWHIAKVTTTIFVSSENKILSTHIIKTVGRSSSNNTNALSVASKYFKKEIENLGIAAILFY